MEKLVIVIQLLFSLFKLISSSEQDSEPCTGNTKCVPLPTCIPYMNLLVHLSKPLQPSIVTFLKTQQCGFKNGYPNVCCRMLPSRVRVIKQTKYLPPQGPELLSIPLPDAGPELIWIATNQNREINQKTVTSSAPPKLTNIKLGSDIWDRKEQNRWEYDQLNMYTLDSFTPFDLFRRRRKVQGAQDVEIEIR